MALPLVTALLGAAALRLQSVVDTFLAAYLMLAAEIAAVTLLLSPFEAVTRTGLASAAEVGLAAAAVAWWVRDRPSLGLRRGAAAARALFADPVILVLGLLVAGVLLYELVLVLTTPANNWDSLTYHLPRAAAWTQHDGIFWIPDPPTDRINEFQPLAEQMIFYLFVATGKGALFALPQFLAQLAIVAAVFSASRSLGFDRRPAACAALLLPTFSLVALEATTSQNDLVAASFPVIALALILRRGTVTAVLAGISVSLGLGTKLTTALVLPVLIVIAWRIGRTRMLLASAGAVVGFAAFAMWSFLLNLDHTGHVLGQGESRGEYSASPSFPGSLIMLVRTAYRLLDLTGLRTTLIGGASLVAIAAVLGVLVLRRRGRLDLDTGGIVLLAGVALAPCLVLGTAEILHWTVDTAAAGTLPIVNGRVNEDISGFGPLGAVAIVTAVSLPVVAALRGKRDDARLALATALPVFLVLLALTAKYNPWISRFLIVPVVLTAPLFAALFSRRTIVLAGTAVATTGLWLTVKHNELKPLHSVSGPPWSLTAYEAAALTWKPVTGATQREVDRLVPARACIGASVGSDDPSYLLYGPRLDRRVSYLPRDGATTAAVSAGLRYVVVDTDGGMAAQFAAAGWTMRPLTPADSPFWTLAERKTGAVDGCPTGLAAGA